MTGGTEGGPFATTLWTEVLRAVDPETPRRREALDKLIGAYWKPLYSYSRRRGHSAQTSQDHVQGFFTRLLEKDWLSAADPERGRFRTYLRTAFSRYLSNEADHAAALKRGGDHAILSLDFEDAERGLSLDPADPRTPDQHFDREWAVTVLRRANDRLRVECEEQDREIRYQLLQAALGGDEGGHQGLADRFGIRLHDVKNHLFQARTRLRVLMLEEISSLVDGEADSELQELWKALG